MFMFNRVTNGCNLLVPGVRTSLRSSSVGVDEIQIYEQSIESLHVFWLEVGVVEAITV